MNEPPGKEKGARQGALSPNQNYDARTVARPSAQGNLFPELVERLQAAGVTHEYRRGADEVMTRCPWCGGKLRLHLRQPWHFCFSAVRLCPVDKMEFDAVVSGVLRGRDAL